MAAPSQNMLYEHGTPAGANNAGVSAPAPPLQAPPACSYVDFVPSQLGAVTFSYPQYSPFRELIPVANQWLAANPGQEVVACESCEVKVQPNQPVRNDESVFYESGRYRTCFVRILRVWLRPRGPKDPQGPTQIAYLNVVPASAGGGTFSLPTFMGFGDTITSINEMFKTNPLPGKILNVETLDVKFENWSGSVDPDVTFWVESGRYNTYFLNLIRIFYKQGPPANELIGTVDFVPPQTAETYASLMGQANGWLQSQPPMDIVSMQSIDYKVDHTWNGTSLDTQRTLYRESGRYATYFIRILRITYLINGGHPPAKNPAITYRTFEPHRVGLNHFETLSQTMARAQAWLSLTGVKVVGAETVPVVMTSNHQQVNISERTCTRQSGKFATYFLLCIRLYFDTPYNEPPPELLPPVPVPPPPPAVVCNML